MMHPVLAAWPRRNVVRTVLGTGGALLLLALLPWIASTPAQQEPKKTVAAIRAADDLQVTLWAHEPQLYAPTAFDIDEKGRVWVCEGINYRGASGPRTKDPPYYLTPHRKTGDRIVVLEDT